MNAQKIRRWAACIGLLLATGLAGQEISKDHVSIPFRDPDRPGRVKAALVNGDIVVTGYDGKTVLVEAKVREIKERRSGRPNGPRRLELTPSHITVEEEANEMRISVVPGRVEELVLKVPFNTSLELACSSSGDIRVQEVIGEIEVNNSNGEITLNEVSGAVIAHALNTDITVKVAAVAPKKIMTLSSLNGDIQLTLPSQTNAELKLETFNGDLTTEFEVTLRSLVPRRSGKAIHGTINGGGPLITLKSHNGDITIRKAKGDLTPRQKQADK